MFILAFYFGEIVSPLATETCGVEVGSTFVQVGSADSCIQCNVAAKSTSATGILVGDTTEIVDKDGLYSSYFISVQHRQVQLRVDLPCMFEKVAVATWLVPGLLQYLTTCAQLPCV